MPSSLGRRFRKGHLAALAARSSSTLSNLSMRDLDCLRPKAPCRHRSRKDRHDVL